MNDLPPSLELRLTGTGVVRGRVLDRHGLPAAGLYLLVIDPEGDRGDGSTEAVPGFAKAHALKGGGNYKRRCMTDHEGRFECVGLREGVYSIRAHDGRTRSTKYPWLLTQAPVMSDGREFVLRLEGLDRPYFAVRVRDVAGRPFEEFGLSRYGSSWGFMESLPDFPVLMVVPSGEEAWGSDSFERAVDGALVGRGEAVFELPGGGDFQVLLLARGSRPSVHEVQVDASDGRVEVFMDLQEEVGSGELVVQVTSPDGAPAESAISVRLVDPVSGVPVVERRDFSLNKGERPWPWRVEVPVGDYRLDVESLPTTAYLSCMSAEPRPFGAFGSVVSIRPFEETHVQARLSEPGYLKVHLVGPTSRDTEAAARDGSLRTGALRESLANSARLMLLRKGYFPIPAQFARRAFHGTSSSGGHLSSWADFGEERTSEALPAGRFVLEAKLPDGRVAVREVVIVPGSTTEVELVFE